MKSASSSPNNLKELRISAEKFDMNPDIYCLPGDVLNLGHTVILRHLNATWICFIQEPGRSDTINLYFGDSEKEACQAMWNELTNPRDSAQMPNCEELQRDLKRRSIDISIYTFGKPTLPGVFVIEQTKINKWCVYFWNGYSRQDECFFERERHACRSMLGRIIFFRDQMKKS